MIKMVQLSQGKAEEESLYQSAQSACVAERREKTGEVEIAQDDCDEQE
jgi:hypothetical protein